MLDVTNVLGWWDAGDNLFSFLKKETKDTLEKSWAKKTEALQNLASFEAYRNMTRKRFLEMIGGLPREKTPLNPRFFGETEEENHIIRKVAFESLPQFYVTANLYLPKRYFGRLPAVLLCCGHVKDGKGYPVYRKAAIDLVENGFIVLFFDPIGQGERIECVRETAAPRWGSAQHDYDGLRFYLLGENIARYFIWDGIRAIDFLTSLPEVDKEKIGVTGHSGGALQTAYLMMTDERVKAALPFSCVYTSSQYVLMCTGKRSDAEQHLYRSVKYGIDAEDFFFCFAPKPALIGAHAYDYHPIEGSYLTFHKAKIAYQLYHKEENIKLVVSPTEHDHDSYASVMRRACVEWFSRHLKGEKIKFKKSENIKLVSQEQLLCVPEGGVKKFFPKSKLVCEIAREEAIMLADKRVLSAKEIKAKLKNLLGLGRKKTEFNPRIRELTDSIHGGRLIHQKYIFFFTEEGIICAGMFYYPEDYKDTVLLLLEEGTSSIFSEEKYITQLLRDQKAVFIFEPRGIGGLKSRELSGETESVLAYNGLLLGYPLIGMRVWDLLQGIKFIRMYAHKEIILAGRGKYASLYALLAAVLEDELKEIWLYGMKDKFSSLVKERSYDFHSKGVIPGILKYFDTDDLVKLLEKKMKFCRILNEDTWEQN